MSSTTVTTTTKGPYAMRLEAVFNATVAAIVTKAKEVDTKFHVVDKVTDVLKTIDNKYGVLNKLGEIDKTYSVKAKASAISEKVLNFAHETDKSFKIKEKVDLITTWVLSY